MTERISFQDISKGLFDGMMKTELYLKNAGLDHQLLELVKYRVSQINGCAYCLDMHHQEAIALGETELRLHSLAAWRDCPYFDEKERAALAYAEALTDADHHAIDKAFDTLATLFPKAEIADLTIVITQTNAWNRINCAFKREPGKYRVGMHG